MEAEEEDDELEQVLISPFRLLLHRAMSILWREEEILERQLLDLAVNESMETHHRELFAADPTRKARLEIEVLTEAPDDECHLCLEDMRVGESVARLACGHVFHAACTQELVAHRHVACPLCRKSIPLEQSEEHSH